MANPQSSYNLENEELEGRLIIRRFTNELAGVNELERQTKAAQAEIDENEEQKERQRLEWLYKNPGNRGDVDFINSEIARNMLQKSVTDFVANDKPSMLQRIGFSHQSTKSKANKMLQDMITSDVSELKAYIDGLEEGWKNNNGSVYRMFKRVCKTLDDHKSIFSIFPSKNEYTEVLVSSISCLVKAAKSHSEIAELLADSISRISENVTRVAKVPLVFPTDAIRKKLADIYTTMFEFFRKAIEWYLKRKLDRAFSAFNENLKAGFETTEKNLNANIEELYREANISSYAMMSTVDRKVDDMGRLMEYICAEQRRQRSEYERENHFAGHLMVKLLYSQARQLEPAGQKYTAVESAPSTQDKAKDTITLTQAREYSSALERYIVGDEGPAKFTKSQSWVAEDGVLPKLKAWMVGGPQSRNLWISSPPDLGGMTSAQASALAVWAAAWQAKTPLISHFCQRPRREQLRPGSGMSIEQTGLMGLVYSLLCQLLQFRHAEDTVSISEDSLKALDGERDSWETGLKVLVALLENTPKLTYCVIDGLNDLELGDGAQWCQQLLEVLFARQRVAGITFNILLTTAGQSRLLASVIDFQDRYLAHRPARELQRWGRIVELEAPIVEHGGQ